ncbi:hypothetical protein [Roseofilum casamattae]|uniref:Uncharacterized protein n=1 Tax=Roseofilum casamattae BLCC-M143 TaxID=3022442 RepID=A0ABT7BS30_9CYAN|nr:hypothetical protein [Roseofilum casamattae]MDJ1181994.1 hypothetical protein [Roseofilum casamattae BLCC-M143]
MHVNPPVREMPYPPVQSAQTPMSRSPEGNLPGRSPRVSTQLPRFPKNKALRFTRHHNRAYPDRVADLLVSIGERSQQWQEQLAIVHQQIEILYNQGPILEAWLESTPKGRSVNRAGAEPLSSSYRLCGLDEQGNAWSRPCPPEEIAAASLAIHRYQQLRQFLNQKHMLEARLSQLAQSLMLLETQMAD